MKKNILGFIIFFSILSCTHEIDDLENICSPSDDCSFGIDSFMNDAINNDTTFTFLCPFDWIETYPDQYQYQYPCFNPNNENQIAFRRWDTKNFNLQLCTFDFCIGEINVLTENISGFIDWGANNWILFTKFDSQIWKMKSNGDSLSQITTFGSNQRPIWNNIGSKFIYSNQIGSESMIYVLNDKNTIIDTIESLERKISWDWSSNNLFSLVQGTDDETYGVGYYNWEKDTINMIDIVGLSSFVYKTRWNKENDEIYWVGPEIIAKTNIHSQNREVIVKGALSRRYEWIDLSPDNSKIITCRKNQAKIDDCLLEIQYVLSIFDIDGENERIIEFPN